MKYELTDGGVDHSQYWQGAGIAYTEWDHVFTGVGETLRDAIDDAFEVASQSGFFFDDEDELTAQFPDSQLDAPLHDATDECQADSESCEHQHYALLYVKEGGDQHVYVSDNGETCNVCKLDFDSGSHNREVGAKELEEIDRDGHV